MLHHPRITLVRHGLSAHRQRGWISAAAFLRWHDAYDGAGLARQEPSLYTRVLADRAALIVTSDMVRARESAALLAPGAPELTSPLLREVDLPIPGWMRWLRAPVSGWIVLSRVAWMMGATEPRPSAESFRAALARAGEAAGWLVALATQRGDVLAVTHGGFRRLLAPALRKRGWRGRTWATSSPPWSAWTFEARER